MTADYVTTSYGKFILAGEHAVIRGKPSIIFPVKSKSFTLQYWHDSGETTAEFSGECEESLKLLFWSTIERALEILDIHQDDISGRFLIENHIPIGAGLGASAALCVAVGRWFVFMGKVPQENLHEFARQLENLFHNESSGADIAAAIANEGIFFSRSGGMHPIHAQWKPHWYLSFSAKQSTTSRCVKKVKELWESDKALAEVIDDDMANSVANAEKALRMSAQTGFEILVDAIDKAHHCFERWGLVDSASEQHIKELKQAGALTAKPTGSGGGGFILSLWAEKPPEALSQQLIPV